MVEGAGQCQYSGVLTNRVTELLGIEIPIVQAPMGWIARSTLASAVSNAGAMGIIETSSGELDAVRDEVAKMKDLTDKPFGVNIAQAFVADPAVIVDFVIAQGVNFVTTSAGSPTRYTAQLKDAGLTVFHVVPTLRAAEKAVTAGVDGLIVEGGEGGGFKNPRPVSTMVLLPSVTKAFDVPVIAAGRLRRRPDDGGRTGPRCRRGADGHGHGLLGRIAGARELETGHCQRRRNRHGFPEQSHLPGAPSAEDNPHRRSRVRP
jgi:enoyl-[acyl-carrier protein] reductase II